MTLEEFMDYTKCRNSDDTIEYKDEWGVFYWGEPCDIYWQHSDGAETRRYHFDSEKEFLESPCFWGKRLKEIVPEITIPGFEEYQKTGYE